MHHHSAEFRFKLQLAQLAQVILIIPGPGLTWCYTLAAIEIEILVGRYMKNMSVLGVLYIFLSIIQIN
jgi:hypothetical protein